MIVVSTQTLLVDGGRGWHLLAEYGAMDAMELLPKETTGRELDMEEAPEIDEHHP